MKYLFLLITIGLSACGNGQDSTKVEPPNKKMDSLITNALAQELVKFMPKYSPDEDRFIFGKSLVELNPTQDLAVRSFYDSVSYFKDFDVNNYELLLPINTNTTHYPYIKAFYKKGLIRKFEGFFNENEVYECFALPSAIDGVVWAGIISFVYEEVNYYYKNTSQNVKIKMYKTDNENEFDIYSLTIKKMRADSFIYQKELILADMNYFPPIKTITDFRKWDNILDWENKRETLKNHYSTRLWKMLRIDSTTNDFYQKESDKWKHIHCACVSKSGKITCNRSENISEEKNIIDTSQNKKTFWDEIIHKDRVYVQPFFGYVYRKPRKNSEKEQNQLAELLDIYSRVVDKKTLEELRIMVLQD